MTFVTHKTPLTSRVNRGHLLVSSERPRVKTLRGLQLVEKSQSSANKLGTPGKNSTWSSLRLFDVSSHCSVPTPGARGPESLVSFQVTTQTDESRGLIRKNYDVGSGRVSPDGFSQTWMGHSCPTSPSRSHDLKCSVPTQKSWPHLFGLTV